MNYLYGNVELPQLPDYDKTKYPYAIIDKDSGIPYGVDDEVFYVLTVCSVPLIAEYPLLEGAPEYIYAHSPCSHSNYWLFPTQRIADAVLSNPPPVNHWFHVVDREYQDEGEELLISSKDNLIWTNHDIYYTDDSICFAGSEPMPVDETWFIQKSTLEGIADSIRAKKGTTDAIPVPNFAREIDAVYQKGVESGSLVNKSNIVCSETAPTDTSNIWIKTNERNIGTITISPAIVLSEKATATPNVSRKYPSCCKYNDNIYLFGGGCDSIEKYEFTENGFVMLENTLPYELGCSTVAVVEANNVAYLFGNGDGGVNTIIKFDFVSETCSIIDTVFPYNTTRVASAVVYGKVYLFGGTCPTSPYVSNKIHVFDTTTETIEELSVTLPTALCEITAVAVGTKIYLFGGSSSGSSFSGTYAKNTIMVFDTETNQITTLSVTLPTAASGVYANLVDDKIYICGGISAVVADMQILDTNTNTIKAIKHSYMSSRSGYWSDSVYVRDRIFYFGYNSSTQPISLMFNPKPSLNANDIIMDISMVMNHTIIVPNTITLQCTINNLFMGNAQNIGECVDAYYHNGSDWELI